MYLNVSIVLLFIKINSNFVIFYMGIDRRTKEQTSQCPPRGWLAESSAAGASGRSKSARQLRRARGSRGRQMTNYPERRRRRSLVGCQRIPSSKKIKHWNESESRLNKTVENTNIELRNHDPSHKKKKKQTM